MRPLLQRLAEAALASPNAPGADAAADGLLLDGMLHYYAGDLATGEARLAAFVKGFPNHRWQGEGRRFLGVVKRLQQPPK